MKQLLQLCLSILLVIPVYTFAQTTNVLFIGNSYTGFNNLQSLVRNAALSTGDTISTQAHTPGGARLMTHAANATVHQLIRSRDWNFVVLQAQSQEPSFSNGQVANEVYPYARALCDSIRANNSCSTPLFYMTWGRKNGDQRNCAVWPPVCTYEGMDSLLNLRYRTMANDNEALVSPVGAVWNHIRKNYPAIELYNADQSHPSLAGSYAAACAFYTMILQKDPTLITFDAGLDQSFTANIKAAAKAVVFDSLSKWNIGKYDPKADFTVNQSSRVYSFSNQSQFSDSVYWDFGDGNSSNDLNPNHTYAQDGMYTVTLIGSKCGKSDTASQMINYSTVSIDPSLSPTLRVYPNPTRNTFHFEGSDLAKIESVDVYNKLGQHLRKLSFYSGEIDISDLKSGVYFLGVKMKTGAYQYIPIEKY